MDIFKVVAVATFIFNKLMNLVKTVVNKTFKYADNLIMKIPGATKVAWEGLVKKNFSWNI